MTTKTTTPAYLQFVAALRNHTAIVPTENAGWVCFQDPTSSHKLYVPKSAVKMGSCHTTLPIDASVPGFIPLPKPNGKIAAHFTSDLELIVTHLLPLLSTGSLRPALVPAKATVSEEAPVSYATTEEQVQEMYALGAS